MQPRIDALPSNSQLIDIHCHRETMAGGWQMLSLDTHELADRDCGGMPETMNKFSEQGGDVVLPPSPYFSIGIHPWFIDRQDIDIAMRLLSAVACNPNLLAIGECGLDKCIATPLALQIDVFTRQIELAEHLGKPLLIHCVKAYNELLQIKKSSRAGPAWIIHGFNANPVLAAQLINHGCYLSFGAALLNPQSLSGRALAGTPLERLFLETDTADVPIGAIYAAAAKMLRLNAATLGQQILNNFNRVFLND
ncbi:MAG: TatD family hydrolase [Methylomonas sp.]